MKKIKNYLIVISEIIFLLIIYYFISQSLQYIKKNRNVPQATRLDQNQFFTSSNSADLKYFYEPLPNKPQVWSEDWLKQGTVNKINSDSLNEVKNYEVNKNNNTYRIITLGDSYTYGQYVYTKDNYSKKIETKLNRSIKCPKTDNFEVINLSVPGYDIEYDLARLQKRGLKYKPDLVVWLLTNGNFASINELFFPLKNAFLKQGIPNFDPETKTYPAIKKTYQEVREKYGLKFINDYQKKLLNSIPNIFTGKIMFLTFSSVDVSFADFINQLSLKNNNYSYQKITDLSFKDGERFIDGHPNEKGHERLANEIYTTIREKILTDCMGVNL